ncbi:MAG: hypothetical protein ACRC6T_05985 [Sarcina sp.]
MENIFKVRETESPENNEIFINSSKYKSVNLTTSEGHVNIDGYNFEFTSAHKSLTIEVVKDGIITVDIKSKSIGKYRFKYLSRGKMIKYDWLTEVNKIDFTVHTGDMLYLLTDDINSLAGSVISGGKKQLCIKVGDKIQTIMEL